MNRTTTEHAKAIRNELKQGFGWSSRQVSVRTNYFNLGSAIRVIINDPAVPLETVKAVAIQAERIRRCEFSGEILGGGNRYITVSYDRHVLEIMGRRHADAIQRAVNAVEPGSSGLEPIDGTQFLVGRPNEWRLTLWDRESAGMVQECHSVDDMAQSIAVRRVNDA